MFKKISKIKNMATFKDFTWDDSVRNSKNNVVGLNKINILYGRNYSGKTTLSRIFRAIEKKELPPKYENSEFSLIYDDKKIICQNTLKEHDKIIRVFNQDFVKENLRFVFDDESDITAFAILGEGNEKVEKQLQGLANELGSEEEKEETGLYGKLARAEEEKNESKEKYTQEKNSLEELLRQKAKDIKFERKWWVETIYDIRNIKNDIKKIKSSSYVPIDSEKRDELRNLVVEEEIKTKASDLPIIELDFESLIKETKHLVERKITVQKVIKELELNPQLQKWVLEGRKLHEGKRKECGFCGNILPEDLYAKLDKHFTKESQNLRDDIDILVTKINGKKEDIPVNIDRNYIYSKFHQDMEKANQDYEKHSKLYLEALQSLITELTERKENIITKRKFEYPIKPPYQLLIKARKKLQSIITASNKFSSRLGVRKKEAQKALRLDVVKDFIRDINYDKQVEKIDNLKKDMEVNTEDYQKTEQSIKAKKQEVENLKGELKDEAKGAQKVNELLANDFGHPFLSLVPIKSEDESLPEYHFEVRRGGDKAYNLSEGECNLIAFCYFMAKLNDVETKGSKPIIWIDDPVSSLDSNHIFFVFSLIGSKIVVADRIVAADRYEQLFISTHSLEFLKYLKRIANGKLPEFFVVEREKESSKISVMPNHIKEYVTEFNYLFHQIYKCANYREMEDENHHIFYNFGNNARKFLEIFLYYRYPDMSDEKKKQKRFLGNDTIAQTLIRKLNNEHSHLAGGLERGSIPMEGCISEMQKEASFIIKKIKEKDKEQYDSLVESIGEKPE